MIKVIFLFIVLLSIVRPVSADYILPYPSYMPGHTFYRISRIFDKVNAWWHWGNIAKTKYSLRMADKYLVEAKTLFEYKQYLLALDALTRSDGLFLKIPFYLRSASMENKDVSQLRDKVLEATSKHKQILDTLKVEVPRDYIWVPEKGFPAYLRLLERLDKSVSVRDEAKLEIENL